MSVDQFLEMKVIIMFYASFFWVTEYFRNNSLHSSITKYKMFCKLVKLLILVFVCLYLVRGSLCHCKRPAKTNDIVHISAEFLKMKGFPQVRVVIPLIVESIFTGEMLYLHFCP